MAKCDLRFRDCFNFTNTIKAEHQQQVDEEFNENWINIQVFTKENEIESIISLDKSSAIKFAKTLRTEINKITESEGKNG